jgi:negative regulator of sigma E activity
VTRAPEMWLPETWQIAVAAGVVAALVVVIYLLQSPAKTPIREQSPYFGLAFAPVLFLILYCSRHA